MAAMRWRGLLGEVTCSDLSLCFCLVLLLALITSLKLESRSVLGGYLEQRVRIWWRGELAQLPKGILWSWRGRRLKDAQRLCPCVGKSVPHLAWNVDGRPWMYFHFLVIEAGSSLPGIKEENLFLSLMEMHWHNASRIKHLNEHAEPCLSRILGINGDNDFARIGWPKLQHFALPW